MTQKVTPGRSLPCWSNCTAAKLARQTADRVGEYPSGIEVYLVKGVSGEVACLRIRIKHSSSNGQPFGWRPDSSRRNRMRIIESKRDGVLVEVQVGKIVFRAVAE